MTSKTYQVRIDGGQGGETTLAAADLADAVRRASAWARAGEWREDGTVVVSVSGPDGKQTVDVPVKQSPLFAEAE
jgi:hypothetical protein